MSKARFRDFDNHRVDCLITHAALKEASMFGKKALMAALCLTALALPSLPAQV